MAEVALSLQILTCRLDLEQHIFTPLVLCLAILPTILFFHGAGSIQGLWQWLGKTLHSLVEWN